MAPTSFSGDAGSVAASVAAFVGGIAVALSTVAAEEHSDVALSEDGVDALRWPSGVGHPLGLASSSPDSSTCRRRRRCRDRHLSTIHP